MSGSGVSLGNATSAPAFEATSPTSSLALSTATRVGVTLTDIGDELRSFPVGEGEVEHHRVERLAGPDQGPPLFQRAGQDDLRALSENEFQGLRENRVVFYDHHAPHRHTSAQPRA